MYEDVVMRINRILKEYDEIKRLHEEKGEAFPEVVQNMYEEKLFIDTVWRTLNRFADGNAISKSGWQWISQMCEEECARSSPKEVAIVELQKLHCELMSEQESLLIDGHTLSKEGRKRLRKTCALIGKLL